MRELIRAGARSAVVACLWDPGAVRACIAAGVGARVTLDVAGVKVILISYRWQTLDPEMLRFVGIDPTAEKILMVKSTIHYRAAFARIVREIIEVDAPGLCSSNLARFHFRRVRRPIFPLDPDAPRATPSIVTSS